MGVYKIEFKKSVEKDFRTIPKDYLKKILLSIDALAKNPRPQSSVKLTAQNAYRIRVGIYRIVYEVHDDVLIVLVIRVAHRKGVYR